MVIPPPIKKGDKIRVVSPAGKIQEEHILPAINWLENQGYVVGLGKHIFNQHYQFAGTKKQRLEDLQAALDDSEASAIICSRGGYGAVQIVEQLDFTTFKKHPKWLVGFSDITLLHSYLNNLGYVSIHGVMPRYFLVESGEPSQNLLALFNVLTNQKISFSVKANPFNKMGIAEGKLVGGNLSIIGSLMGTSLDIDMDGCILFIEDINEYLYKIDRLMHQLKLSSKLKLLKGLVIGSFTGMQDNKTPFGKTAWEIISEAVGEYNYPVLFGFPAGHDAENLPLLLGAKYKLEVTAEVSNLTLK